MVTGARRRHHAVADRLEDLGLAEVGNQQPERQRIGRRTTAFDEGPGARAAFDEAGLLEVPDRAADGDPRDGEARPQLGLARQAAARLPGACLYFPAKGREDLPMLDGSRSRTFHRCK